MMSACRSMRLLVPRSASRLITARRLKTSLAETGGPPPLAAMAQSRCRSPPPACTIAVGAKVSDAVRYSLSQVVIAFS